MNFTLKDIKHLNIMADLENNAIKKQKIDISALLKQEPKELNLDQKIVSLCSKLRSNGFEKQAENLEDKFLVFKSASTHLYKVFEEEGKDLVEFAHPDGDAKMADADNELGVVETVLSRHKKIVDVVNKKPTGKLASKTNSMAKLANVVVSDIGKKFKYMADYISQHALTNVPEGSSLTPQQRNYYGAAAIWRDVANLIASELNMPSSLPERDVVQLVKNRLKNNQNAIVNQHASEVNSIADVDELIQDVLNLVEDKNPNKKVSNLFKYLDECKIVLAQTTDNQWALIKDNYDIATLYKLGLDKMKTAFAHVLRKEDLDELIMLSGGTSRLGWFINDMGSFSSLNSARSHLEAMNESINRFQNPSPITAQTIKVMGEYESMFETLLNKVNAIPDNRKEAYRNEARIAWGYFSQALEKIQSSDNEPAAANVPNIIGLQRDEIQKLNDWKNKLKDKPFDDAKKQHISDWIDGQIKELQTASKAEQINKVIEEDKRFESKGLI